MATYVVGDLHGCWHTFARLLDRIAWDAAADRLWLVGDLVNRGPESLAVLRWAVAHQGHIVSVLGNHDLHLLACAAGLRRARPGDTLGEILAAPDRDELLGWLRRRPLLHHEDGRLMVHAGLMPGWRREEAIALADEVASRLAEDDGLSALYALRKARWRPGLGGDERLAAALGVFTLLRVVGADGRPRLGFTGPPAAAPDGARAWFEGSRVVAAGASVLFGHWARLGVHRHGSATCMDSGCVWGGGLSALRLDDGRMLTEPVAAGERAPWPGADSGKGDRP